MEGGEPGPEGTRGHGAVGDSRAAALGDGNETGGGERSTQEAGGERALVGAHARAHVERARGVAKESHRRVPQVGIEGEDDSAGSQHTARLGERSGEIRQVMQHAREGDHVGGIVGERELRRIAAQPDRVARPSPPRVRERDEREIEAEIAAPGSGVDAVRGARPAAEVDDATAVGWGGGEEGAAQNLPAGREEGIEALGGECVESRRLAGADGRGGRLFPGDSPCRAQMRPSRISSATQGITSSSISDSVVVASKPSRRRAFSTLGTRVPTS